MPEFLKALISAGLLNATLMSSLGSHSHTGTQSTKGKSRHLGGGSSLTLPISEETVSDSLLTKLATNPIRQGSDKPVASAAMAQSIPASPDPHTLPCTCLAHLSQSGLPPKLL